MEDEPEDWEKIGHVISSRYRVTVLERLVAGPATPSTIADDTDNSIAHVSRALRNLRERGLVELLVPEERSKGRVYGVTDAGRAAWKTIDAENLA